MKRPLLIGALTIIIDQILKLYFQIQFSGKEVYFLNDWGFTYTANSGLWINQNISKTWLSVLQIMAVMIWAIVYFLVKYYHAYYRKSLLIDFAFGFYSVATFGNIIDKIFLGYIRDYFINPVAISNLADISVLFAVIIFFLEIITFPQSRKVLKFKMSLNTCYNNYKKFLQFIKSNDKIC